jgi:hypothetical protein
VLLASRALSEEAAGVGSRAKDTETALPVNQVTMTTIRIL